MGYDAIYYMVPKHPIQNLLENFPNQFGLGHFDVPKSYHEFVVLLTALDSQIVALHISHPESC